MKTSLQVAWRASALTDLAADHPSPATYSEVACQPSYAFWFFGMLCCNNRQLDAQVIIITFIIYCVMGTSTVILFLFVLLPGSLSAVIRFIRLLDEVQIDLWSHSPCLSSYSDKLVHVTNLISRIANVLFLFVMFKKVKVIFSDTSSQLVGYIVSGWYHTLLYTSAQFVVIIIDSLRLVSYSVVPQEGGENVSAARRRAADACKSCTRRADQ